MTARYSAEVTPSPTAPGTAVFAVLGPALDGTNATTVLLLDDCLVNDVAADMAALVNCGPALLDVARERRRQVEDLGYTAKHDDDEGGDVHLGDVSRRLDDELAAAFAAGDIAEVRRVLVQSAAVAVATVDAIDRIIASFARADARVAERRADVAELFGTGTAQATS